MLHKFLRNEYHCKHCGLHIREVEPSSHCPELPIENRTEWMKKHDDRITHIPGKESDDGEMH